MVSYNFSKMTDGLNNLTNGYLAYAEEVIINRALPALQDGLKPVNRRILATLYKVAKKGERIKSADLAGTTMKLHPHGDGSIYSAMVLLTDRNGSMALPVLEGHGNFGGVNTTDPPAASRYTEVKMHENAKEYFKDMAGITMLPNYDSSTTEPEYLPVTYPAILCNAQEGIAVGVSCAIPSFNFNDVLDLTMEYLRDGKCSTVICPDFVTGGYYIRNNKELDKLMKGGKAKIKLRGKVTKVGKELSIVEFPYGVKIQTLLKQIQKSEINGIRDCGDVSDFEHGESILVDCVKNKVDEVLLALYRDTDLQCEISANLVVVLDGKPVKLGVWGIVEEWVKWRRKVVLKKLQKELESINAEMVESRAFMEVFNDTEKKDHMIELVLRKSDDEAIRYILDNFDNEIVTPDLARWLISRRLNVFRTGGKYAIRYKELINLKAKCESNIQDVDSYILAELEELKRTKGAEHPRRTEITNTDYEFKVADNGEIEKDTTECCYTLKDGFLKKTRNDCEGTYDYKFNASASDTLIALDNRGRVLRVYCEDLPYNGVAELGIYLPRYLDINETNDYRVTWIGVLDGSTKMLIYTDGNVGFLDTSEWVGLNRKVRVIERGIAVSVADKLGAVIDIPDCLYVMDNEGKLGAVMTDTIKRKDRTAKTRVFNLTRNTELTYYIPMTRDDSIFFVTNMSRYMTSKLMYLESESDLRGDPNLFIPMMSIK